MLRTSGLRALALVAPIATVVAASGMHLADRGFTVVHHCVPVAGTWGLAGVHLALVRESAACPVGTAALGGDPASAATVVGVLALPVLLCHVVALLAGWGASSYLHRVHGRWARIGTSRPRGRAAGLVALLRAVLDDGASVARSRLLAARSAAPVRRLHHLVLGAVHPRRGPPSGVLALA